MPDQSDHQTRSLGTLRQKLPNGIRNKLNTPVTDKICLLHDPLGNNSILSAIEKEYFN